jgi:hypothetical protein
LPAFFIFGRPVRLSISSHKPCNNIHLYINENLNMKKATIVVWLAAAILLPVARAQTITSAQSRILALAEKQAAVNQQFERLAVQSVRSPQDVMTKQTNRRWENGAWVNFMETRFFFEGGKESQDVTYSWDGGEWVELSRIVYGWDGDYLESEVNETWDGSAWQPVSRYLNEMSGGITEVSLYQEWSGNAWVDVDRTTTTLEDGLPVFIQIDEKDGAEWVPATRD